MIAKKISLLCALSPNACWGALLALVCCCCCLSCGREPRLALAVRACDAASVNSLLRSGSDANILTNAKWPVLVEATYLGSPDIPHLLLQYGARVDAANPNGFTALMEASKNGDLRTVRELLTKGANVNAADSQLGWTALMLATFGGHEQIIELLSQAGADVNTADKMGRTPLMWAFTLGRMDLVRQLISEGANVNKADKLGGTPLKAATESGDVALVRQLIAEGADVNARNSTGVPTTPLMEAITAKTNSLAILRMLLEAGADVDLTGWQGETPLTMAARWENDDAALIFISKGAEVNVVGGFYQKSPLIWAVKHNDAKVVRALLKAGAFVDAKVDDLVLCAACEAQVDNDSLGVLQLLLQHGANPDARRPISDRTLLMEAASAGNVKAINILLRAGARAGAVDSDRMTAAMIAKAEGKTDAASVLLAAEAREREAR